MKTLNKLSISQQLVSVSLILVVAVIACLVGFVSSYSQRSALAGAQSQLRTRVHGARELLDLSYEISVDSANRLANLLVSRYPEPMTLHADKLLKIGAIETPVLEYAGKPLNLDFAPVDDFTRMTGGVATIFARKGDDFVRITTSLKTEAGARAIGTLLARDSPAYANMIAGKPYLGQAKLFGKNYITKYVPQQDAGGKVVAILFIGFDLSPIMSSLEQSISAIKFGETGYAYVLRAQGPETGRLMFHPAMAGKNLLESKDADGNLPFKALLEGEAGRLTYNGLDAKGEAGRKLVAYERSKSWGGVVVAGDTAEREMMGDAVLLRDIVLTSGAVAALALAMLLYLFIRSRLKPIGRLNRALDEMGRGNLGVRLAPGIAEGETRNELDLIAVKLDQTCIKVGETIAAIRSNAQSLADTAQALSQTASQLESGSDAQHSATEAMAAGVEQMSVSVSSVSDNAQEATRFTERTRELSGEGNRAVEKASAQISQIAHSVEGAAGQIGRLGEESQRISKVVDMIRGIASQTNLLALNAAIEAARAGEQGRGFAVVADEVRKLAERTTQATAEIGSMVQAIQGGAQDAVEGMKGSLELVQGGV
ncbi:MAG TPA: methyl-accepting chemotaxis protein, partial [Burkholderiales bacterium]|nr:methyl-accepting chemotaxis protein [Burkholderiales bacterium]